MYKRAPANISEKPLQASIQNRSHPGPTSTNSGTAFGTAGEFREGEWPIIDVIIKLIFLLFD